jgi:hypothetical protein
MLHVTEVEHVDGFRIRLRFNNGAAGVVDLADALWGPVFEPLQDLRQFAKIELSPEMHTICWPNGADLAPEYLYETMLQQAQTSLESGRA